MNLPSDSSLEGLFLGLRAKTASTPSPLEEEVLALFSEFRGPLLRYVRSLGLPTPDGEEVAQEVFLALFLHLRQGRPRTNLRAWIFTTGHHLALRQRMRNERLSRLHCEPASAENQLDPTPGPEEQMENVERQRHLMAIVQALPENDRSCLYLRARGLRYREIAKAVGISLGAVSLALGRAVARLTHADKR